MGGEAAQPGGDPVGAVETAEQPVETIGEFVSPDETVETGQPSGGSNRILPLKNKSPDAYDGKPEKRSSLGCSKWRNCWSTTA